MWSSQNTENGNFRLQKIRSKIAYPSSCCCLFVFISFIFLLAFSKCKDNGVFISERDSLSWCTDCRTRGIRDVWLSNSVFFSFFISFFSFFLFSEFFQNFRGKACFIGLSAKKAYFNITFYFFIYFIKLTWFYET